MANLSTFEAGLNEVSALLLAYRKQAKQAQATISTLDANLAAIATNYATLASDINAASAADPGNAILEHTMERKDLLLAERAELQTLVTALNTAAAGVEI